MSSFHRCIQVLIELNRKKNESEFVEGSSTSMNIVERSIFNLTIHIIIFVWIWIFHLELILQKSLNVKDLNVEKDFSSFYDVFANKSTWEFIQRFLSFSYIIILFNYLITWCEWIIWTLNMERYKRVPKPSDSYFLITFSHQRIPKKNCACQFVREYHFRFKWFPFF